MRSDVLLLLGTLGQLPDGVSLAHVPTFGGAARNCSNSVTTPTSSSHPALTPATSPQYEHSSFPEGCRENIERAICRHD